MKNMALTLRAEVLEPRTMFSTNGLNEICENAGALGKSSGSPCLDDFALAETQCLTTETPTTSGISDLAQRLASALSIRFEEASAITIEMAKLAETCSRPVTFEQWNALGAFVKFKRSFASQFADLTTFHGYVDTFLFAPLPEEDSSGYQQRRNLLDHIWTRNQKLVVYVGPASQIAQLEEDSYDAHLALLHGLIGDLAREDNYARRLFDVVAIGREPSTLDIPENVILLAFDSSLDDILRQDAFLWWHDASYSQNRIRYQTRFEESGPYDATREKLIQNAYDDFEDLYANWNVRGSEILRRAIDQAVAGESELLHRLILVGFDDHVNSFAEESQTFRKERIVVDGSNPGDRTEVIFLGGAKYDFVYANQSLTRVDETSLHQQIADVTARLTTGTWDVNGDGTNNHLDIDVIRDAYRAYESLDQETAAVQDGIDAFANENEFLTFLEDLRRMLAAHAEATAFDSCLSTLKSLKPRLVEVFVDDVIAHSLRLLSETTAGDNFGYPHGKSLGTLVQLIRDHGDAHSIGQIQQLLDEELLKRSVITGETSDQFEERAALAHELWTDHGIVLYYDESSFLQRNGEPHTTKNLHEQHLERIRGILTVLKAGYPPHKGIASIVQIGHSLLNWAEGRYTDDGDIILSPLFQTQSFVHEYGHGIWSEVIVDDRGLRSDFETLFKESEAEGTDPGDFVSTYGQRHFTEEFAELVAHWGVDSEELLDRALMRASAGKPLLLEKTLLLHTLFPDDGLGQVKTYHYDRTQNALGQSMFDVCRDARGRFTHLQLEGVGYRFGYNELGRLASLEITEQLLSAGDANCDGTFDEIDIIQVTGRGKYLTDEPATWESGDWNGDTAFNQTDLVLALQHTVFQWTPFAADSVATTTYSFSANSPY